VAVSAIPPNPRDLFDQGEAGYRFSAHPDRRQEIQVMLKLLSAAAA
jgi:hypothetical protein